MPALYCGTLIAICVLEKFVAIKVPSAIVNEEANVVINPLHPDYRDVELSIIRPFTFDNRMFK